MTGDLKRSYRNCREREVSVCAQYWTRLRIRAEKKGKLEGMIQVYYKELHYSADQISRELDTPVDQIQEIIRKLTK